jgi:hypothetical protein
MKCHWKVPQERFRLNGETGILNSYSTTPIYWPFSDNRSSAVVDVFYSCHMAFYPKNMGQGMGAVIVLKVWH